MTQNRAIHNFIRKPTGQIVDTVEFPVDMAQSSLVSPPAQYRPFLRRCTGSKTQPTVPTPLWGHITPQHSQNVVIAVVRRIRWKPTESQNTFKLSSDQHWST